MCDACTATFDSDFSAFDPTRPHRIENYDAFRTTLRDLAIDNKIKMIRLVRDSSGGRLDLREAKELVERIAESIDDAKVNEAVDHYRNTERIIQTMTPTERTEFWKRALAE